MINLRAYWAYTRSTLQLTMRDRTVLFFSYLFPLIFFIAFGEGLGAAQGAGAATQVIVMVLVLGVLGNGFFGGGMRATHERETGILRRFKVAPITPAPILVASIVTGWVIYMPAIFLFFGISRWRYGLPFPENWVSLLVFLFFGVIAFRSMGLIVAAVVNSMAESQIIIQLLYFPMLLLSGATIPLSILPEWLQVIAQFLPATHLYLGMQGILMKNETLFDQAAAVGALTLATVVCLFIGVKLFRWEKDDRLKPSAKLWVAAALLPFLLIGGWQAYSLENLRKTRIIDREQRRSLSWLIRDARVFIGDGEVLEIGTVLVRGGRIEAVWPGRGPDPREIRAEMLEAAG
ncbi:MAG: ABC transporter permease, partial [Solibacteraceae bacterium]|nr:ABC transporter permease [Solibacteraceae bacterium]